jgi:hypothetical protein
MRVLAFLAFVERKRLRVNCTLLQKQGRTTNEKKGTWGAGFIK